MDRLKAQDITFFNRGPQPTANQDASYKSKIGQQFDINGNIKSITVFLITIGDEIDNLFEVQKNTKKKQSNKKGGMVVSTTLNIEGRPIDIRVKDMRYLMDDMQGICKQIIKYEKKLPECIKGVIIIMNKSSKSSKREKNQQQSLKDFLKIWNHQKQDDCPLNIIISVPGEQFSANSLLKMQQLCKQQKKIIIQLSEPIKLHQMMEKLYILKCSQYGIEEEFKKIMKNHEIIIQKLKSRKFKLQYSIIHKIDEDWKQRMDVMVTMITSLLNKYESTLKLIKQQELEQNKVTDRFVYLNKSLQQISTAMQFINEEICQYKKNESKISQNNVMEEKQEEIQSLTNQINGKQERWRLKLKILTKIKLKLQNQLKDCKIIVDSIRQKYKSIIEEMQKQLNIFQSSTKQISEVNERFIIASSQSSIKNKVNSLDFDIENELDTSQIMTNNQTDEEQSIYKNKLGYKMKFQEKSMRQFYKKLFSILSSFKNILCFEHQNIGFSEKQPKCLLIQSFLQQKLEQINLEENIDFIKRSSAAQISKSSSGINDTPEYAKSSIMPNSAIEPKSKSNQKEEQKKYIREKIKAAVKEAKDIIQRYDVDKIEDIRYNMKYLQWQISIEQYFLTILKDNWEVLKSKQKDKKN